jgi:hypothetical protein
MEEFSLPDIPVFDTAQIDRCNASGDYRPLLFEWYKYVGIICNLIASIKADSPALRDLPLVHYSVLVGLLNRCSRLMLSNIALSSTGKFGETTRILDRCIAETALTVIWLCRRLEDDSFTRFLANGLKNDLILKSEIEKNIANRGQNCLVIEDRMFQSIGKRIRDSGLSEQQIKDAKQLPDLASIMTGIELDSGAYTAIQRMGSHAVHGTWTDLCVCYLQCKNDGTFELRDNNVQTHHNQYVVISLLVLKALRGFIKSMTVDTTNLNAIFNLIDTVEGEIHAIDILDYGNDFKSI